MAENFVLGTADVVVVQYEVGKIEQADLKQHKAIAKHQEDMVGENVLEKVRPIVHDVHHQENVPVQVDTTTEANLSKDSIADVVKHQEDTVEGVVPIVDDNVHHQGNVPVKVDTDEEIVR